MKHHVITGAGSGIGQAVADRLRDRGDTLHLLARDDSGAARLAHRYPAAHISVADLADPTSLAAAVTAAAAAGLPERINSLLHIAGVLRLGAVADLDPAAWQTSLTVNLAAPAELTRLLLPRLRHPAGHVVFVNSGAGLRATPEWGAYAASKFGLRALADALRDEEAGSGLRVTTVYPGRTATPMQAAVHEHEDREYTPRRWITPETVASTVLSVLDLPADAVISDVSVRPGPANG